MKFDALEVFELEYESWKGISRLSRSARSFVFFIRTFAERGQSLLLFAGERMSNKVINEKLAQEPAYPACLCLRARIVLIDLVFGNP